MRRKDDTLRDTLLDIARTVADTNGIDAVNIRSIAKEAGVAAGTVYNYFSNKDEILLALTEEYWEQALLEMEAAITSDSFCGQLEEVFSFLQKRIEQSGGKLMSSLGNVETEGRTRMDLMQTALEAAFIRRMEQDTAVRGDVWNADFTKEQFVRFIMMNMTMLLKTRASSPDFLIAVVRRILY